MTHRYQRRLAELGIELPEPVAPLANYLPYAISGDTVTISGQLPLIDGAPQFLGRVGAEVSVDEARQAARTCGLLLIAHLRAALDGNLDRMRRCVKLGGFVASAPDFTDHPAVVNGASDLMVEVFGDAGRHARFAVGVASLPRGAPVEIEAVFARL